MILQLYRRHQLWVTIFFFPWKNALIQKKHKELITNYSKDKRIDVQHYMEVF